MATREELLANPAASNAAAEAVVAAASSKKRPELPDPPPDLVRLPGGLIKNGEVYREVKVRELDGHAEEALARALQPPAGTDQVNWAHFMQVLLERGTEQVIGFDKKQTAELLKDMSTGDRDAIVLGIRRATYQDKIDLPGWTCPACGKPTAIAIDPDEDIPVTRIEDPLKDSTFTVALRKGRTAQVRLVTGRDEAAIFERSDLNGPERESIMLQKCLLTITDANGQETAVAAFSQTIVMGLSIPDRKAIVRELDKHQPGPRYNEITFVHQDCQKEVPLVVNLGILFPDLF